MKCRVIFILVVVETGDAALNSAHQILADSGLAIIPYIRYMIYYRTWYNHRVAVRLLFEFYRSPGRGYVV